MRPGAGPAAATLDPLFLPRASALTDALVAPGAPPITPEKAVRWRDRLAAELAQVAGPVTAGTSCLRIRAYQLGRSLSGTAVADHRIGFRWSARTARRTIGVAAVRACVDGRAPTVADAVAMAMTDPAGVGGVGRDGPGTCADWMATLSRPARTAVAGEATTWATRLWTALEWRRLASPLSVGGPDQWWGPTGPGRLAVQGRADVRVGVPDRPGAYFTMLDGYPRPSARVELTLAALVAVLSRPGDAGPAKVVGWWPDCGRAWIVTVDALALAAAADAVVDAVRTLSRPSQRHLTGPHDRDPPTRDP
jgi:hypothetical protein